MVVEIIEKLKEKINETPVRTFYACIEKDV
jgi:hypothetical protein